MVRTLLSLSRADLGTKIPQATKQGAKKKKKKKKTMERGRRKPHKPMLFSSPGSSEAQQTSRSYKQETPSLTHSQKSLGGT